MRCLECGSKDLMRKPDNSEITCLDCSTSFKPEGLFPVKELFGKAWDWEHENLVYIGFVDKYGTSEIAKPAEIMALADCLNSLMTTVRMQYQITSFPKLGVCFFADYDRSNNKEYVEFRKSIATLAVALNAPMEAHKSEATKDFYWLGHSKVFNCRVSILDASEKEAV